MPRLRRSHQSTNDCSRQFVVTNRFRAAASFIRKTPATVLGESFSVGISVLRGTVHSSKLLQRRNPRRRKPTQVTVNPVTASRTRRCSRLVNRENVCQFPIVEFNPRP